MHHTGGGRARQIVAVRRRPRRPVNLHCRHGVPIFLPLFQLELERLVEESIQKKRKGRKSQFLFTAQLLGKWNLFRDFQRVQIYSIAHKKQKRITAGTHCFAFYLSHTPMSRVSRNTHPIDSLSETITPCKQVPRPKPGVREQRREQEQPADTVRRAVAREEPGVREQEQPADTLRRAVAREEPGVREQEQPVDTVR